jgi:UDP-3-O-[3-hydroxymyristoyl] glucosamine N-acyltransferase
MIVPHNLPITSVISADAQIAAGVRVGHFAVIETQAMIGADSRIGNGTIIERGCEIGAGCVIGHRVVLHPRTQLADGCTIHDGAVLGRAPKGNPAMTHVIGEGHGPTRLAARCQVGANAVLYAGVKLAEDVLVGDLASIREGCTIGAHSIVGRGVMVEYGCRIAPRVKIQTGCYITGETTIEEAAFLGPTVTMANDNSMDRVKLAEMRGPRIGRGVRIGSNAILLPGVNLGDDCAIGAGAVVTRDVEPGTIVTGVPARFLKAVPDDQRLWHRKAQDTRPLD